MQNKQTFGNNILIRLDPDNDRIKLKSGGELFVDTSYEPEKHATVLGTVTGLPQKLQYTGIPNKGMPWKTAMELKIGDKVIVYYLAVINAFRKESYRAIIEGEDKYVFIQYQNIYALIRDGVIIPINGYVLVEPVENPETAAIRDRMAKSNIEVVRLREKTNTEVVFGKVKYMGRPNEQYADGSSDDGVGVNIGDIVIMRKITDIPIEYDLHSKIDGGKKYWRVQRRKIFAVL